MFVGSQVRITLEKEHFYPDLVFYNRFAKCFVIIDLKIGKVTHQDIGQMQMYVNFYSRKIPGLLLYIIYIICEIHIFAFKTEIFFKKR